MKYGQYWIYYASDLFELQQIKTTKIVISDEISNFIEILTRNDHTFYF